MKILPVAVNRYDGLSKVNINGERRHERVEQPVPESISFKGGKSILGGFVAGVVGTVLLSTAAPLAILGAGIAGIGGALLGDAIGGGTKKES